MLISGLIAGSRGLKPSRSGNKEDQGTVERHAAKIQFISAVLHDPDLVIMDEPFSGLDPVNGDLLKDVVLELKRNGKTVIFSTHQMDIAEKICDDICLLNRSEKVLEGSIREVKKVWTKFCRTQN